MEKKVFEEKEMGYLLKIQNPPLVVWQHLWWFKKSLTTFPAIAHTALKQPQKPLLQNPLNCD